MSLFLRMTFVYILACCQKVEFISIVPLYYSALISGYNICTYLALKSLVPYKLGIYMYMGHSVAICSKIWSASTNLVCHIYNSNCLRPRPQSIGVKESSAAFNLGHPHSDFNLKFLFNSTRSSRMQYLFLCFDPVKNLKARIYRKYLVSDFLIRREGKQQFMVIRAVITPLHVTISNDTDIQ